MTIAVISHQEFPPIKEQAQGQDQMEAIQGHQKGFTLLTITLLPHLLHPILTPTTTNSPAETPIHLDKNVSESYVQDKQTKYFKTPDSKFPFGISDSEEVTTCQLF